MTGLMNVKSFVQRAKEQGIKMLVFQITPTRRLFSTSSNDKEMPEMLGTALGWAAYQISKVAGHDATEVLQALQVQVVGVAFKVLEEEIQRDKKLAAESEDDDGGAHDAH